MERKQRAKMPASQRAKQFMPFAAVKGLEKAIAEQDQLLKRRERPEFGEEQVGAVNTILCRLRKGTNILIWFYSCGRCMEVNGQVDRINQAVRELAIDGIHISFDDILAVSELSAQDTKLQKGM